jgi:hypothetical protein
VGHEQLKITSLPTTALAVLLDNQQIPGVEHLTMGDTYFSQNMNLLADIHKVGREFYTLLYQVDIPPLEGIPCHVNSSRSDTNLEGLMATR